MSGYETFARYYDSLTRNVDYEARADYMCRLLEHCGHPAGLTLDLACGTGSLTLALAKRGLDIYGIDSSYAMLSQARQKAADAGYDILYLCQKNGSPYPSVISSLIASGGFASSFCAPFLLTQKVNVFSSVLLTVCTKIPLVEAIFKILSGNLPLAFIVQLPLRRLIIIKNTPLCRFLKTPHTINCMFKPFTAYLLKRGERFL